MFSSFLPRTMPGLSASMMKLLIPLYPASLSVYAKTKNQSACPAPVIHILLPLTT